MNLYLIRHGESQSNYDNKYNRAYYCGQLDVPLTEKGVESAKQLKPYFYNIKINDVYVSDLTRTKETYQYIFLTIPQLQSHHYYVNVHWVYLKVNLRINL